jgi:hypothetical protein
MMNAKILMIGAVALAVAPAIASAAPGGNGSTNGAGFNHTNGPTVTTGQPGADCVALVDSGNGSFPGHSTTAPGSAFNEDPGGVAGSKYAGEQPQNSRNSASVSQYDVACLHGTR